MFVFMINIHASMHTFEGLNAYFFGKYIIISSVLNADQTLKHINFTCTFIDVGNVKFSVY